MNGAMSEAANGAAMLEDIEQQTFLKCCEYAYTGDYTPAIKILDTPTKETLDDCLQSSKRKSKKRHYHAE